MHCVDLAESFQTHVYLQNLASIQPRTSPLKFVGSREAVTLAPVKFARSPCPGRRAGLFFLGGERQPKRRGDAVPVAGPVREPRGAGAAASRDPTNFRGLVLGCIEAKFCK